MQDNSSLFYCIALLHCTTALNNCTKLMQYTTAFHYCSILLHYATAVYYCRFFGAVHRIPPLWISLWLCVTIRARNLLDLLGSRIVRYKSYTHYGQSRKSTQLSHSLQSPPYGTLLVYLNATTSICMINTRSIGRNRCI